MAIKYQKKIHREFAKTLSADAEKAFEEAKKNLPSSAAKKICVEDFMKPEAAAIAKSNIEVCRYFVSDYPERDALTPISDKRKKNLVQTINSCLNAYEDISDFCANESDERYKPIHSKMVKNLSDYFDLTAELLLEDVYGDTYKEFAKKITNEETKAQASAAAKRKATREAKKLR